MRRFSPPTRRELKSLKRELGENFEDETWSLRKSKRKQVSGRGSEPSFHVHAVKKEKRRELGWDRDYEQFLKGLAKNGCDALGYFDSKLYDDNDYSDATLMEDKDDYGIDINAKSADDDDINIYGRPAEDDGINVNGRSADDGDDGLNINGRPMDGDIHLNGRSVDDDDDDINVDGASVDDGDDDINVNGRSADGHDINVNGMFADADDISIDGRSADDYDINGNCRTPDNGLDGAEVDPHYEIFLENLREDGKSYILEVVGKTGITELIKYEQEDEVLGEFNFDSSESSEGFQVKSKDTELNRTLRRSGRKKEQMNGLHKLAPPLSKGATTVRHVLGKRKKETLEISEDLPKKNNSVVKKKTVVEVFDPVSGRRNGRCKVRRGPEILYRPESYKYSPVKQETKIVRTSRSVVKKGKRKTDSRDGFAHLSWTYEGHFVENLREKNRPTKKKKNVNKKPVEHRTNGRRFSGNLGEENISMKKKKNVNKNPAEHRTNGLRFAGNLEENTWMTKKNANKKAAEGRTTNGRPTIRPGLEALRVAKRRRKCADESVQMDEDYVSFLNRIVYDGVKIVYKPRKSEPVTFDADLDSSSSLDIMPEAQIQKLEIKREPQDGCGPQNVAVDVDTGRRIEIRDIGRAKYREGLMKILKRPYDQEEYDKLFKEVHARRPMEYDRQLRNGIITYPVEGRLGKSYRQQHKAFSKKIDEAKGDHPTILNLLRGFFYWLKNVAKEGQFMPWNDKSCLKVLPGVSKERRVPPQLGQKKRFCRQY